MATRDDFTPEEWTTLQTAAIGAATYVSVAQGGFFDSFKEASALAKGVTNAAQNSDSLVIRDLAQIKGAPFKPSTSPLEVRALALDGLRASVKILTDKAPEELDAYKQFVLTLADDVASAADGTSAAETDAITEIKTALEGQPT